MSEERPVTPPAETGDDIEEALGAVADETRLRIVRALWAAEREGATPVGFAALRERAAVDDSGRFNYHLKRLTPRFVRAVEAGDDAAADGDGEAGGYELTSAGRRVIGAVVSGSYTDADATAVGPIDVGECPACGGTVEADYEHGYVTVGCADCVLTFTDGLSAPPVLLAGHEDASDAELAARFRDQFITDVRRLNRRLCPLCGGRMERAFTRTLEHVEGMNESDDETALGNHLDIYHRCTACGWGGHSVAAVAAIDHPATLALLDEADIDYPETPVWEFDWLFDAETTVVDRDPFRAELAITVADERVVLTLDEDVSVIAHERR